MGKIYSIFSQTFWSPMTERDVMFNAIKDNDNKKLEEMIRSGADVTKHNDEGLSLLHYASELGRQLCVQTLLFYNCIDVNARDSSDTPLGPLQTTPLHYAAAEGWPQIVICLLKYGADINAVTITGWTSLHYLSITEEMTSGKLEAMTVLIGMGADVNIRDTEGNHVLDIAILYGHYEVTRILLNSGIDIEAIEPIDPNFIKNDKVFDCVKLCLKAGGFKVIEKYEVMKYLIESSDKVENEEKEDLLEKINCLLSVRSNPQSLKHLCRISIRKIYSKQNINAIIDRLALPDTLRWYILLIEF